MKYLYLALAIILEVVGSSFLVKSDGFSKFVPSLVVVLAFSSCFFFFSLAIREIPLGIAYAIWAGMGLVLTAGVSHFVFGQKLDFPALVGIGFILNWSSYLECFFQNHRSLKEFSIKNH